MTVIVLKMALWDDVPWLMMGLIGQLAIVTLFGAILGGIPLSGPYPKERFSGGRG